MGKNVFLVFVLMVLASGILTAQKQPTFIFSRITKKDGLASNTTFQTTRDQQGYLWIATQNGLQRYDGQRFLTFPHIPGNKNTIPHNTVNHLFVDSKGRLWLLFDKRAGIFSTTQFNFSDTKVPASIFMIRKVTEDSLGRIILFADSKQFLYNESKKEFDSTLAFSNLPAGFTVTDMATDPQTGIQWLTGKQGSLAYDPSTKKFSTAEKNEIKDPLLDSLGPIKNARFPFISASGNRWMVEWIPFSAQAPVLYSYDRTKNKVEKFEKIRDFKPGSYYEIWSVFEQSNGVIWAYGMGLLAYYHPAEKKFIHINSDPFQQNGIDFDYVSNLYEDREKNIWVCTNQGVYRFNPDAQVFRSMNNRRPQDTTELRHAVSTILQTKNHGIWVGTWGAGMLSYNSQWQPIPNPISTADQANRSLHITHMIQRKNGEILIGDRTGEIKIFDPAASAVYAVTPPPLKGEKITQLLEDKHGNLWISSGSGLVVKCEQGKWRDTSSAYRIVLSDLGDIMRLYEDKSDNLWICTSTNGLFQIDIRDGREKKHFRINTDNNDGLLNDGATDIVQYRDSLYLIASGGLCILNPRTNTFKYLTSADGLPASQITNLIIDKQQRIWAALDGGLYRINLDNGLYVTYDAADGISNDIFQVSSSALLADGKIAIGTPDDFMVFDPEQTVDKKPVPPVRITNFALGSNYLSVDSLQKLETVELDYDNTFLRIELSNLNFRDRYYQYYMLEGLDKSWKRVNNGEITYQFLPAGSYTLKLKARNAEGVESETSTTLRLEVEPPFWKTWWFYSILALIAGALLFWLDHERIKRKTAMLKMRSDIADELYQDINTALGNITILSEMAKKKADREPEKSKEFIEQIYTKSRTMTLAMEDILWSIDPNNDSMQNFMLRFREYIDALKSQYNAQIDILIDKKAENLQLKMKLRNDIFSIFKSGITNTVRTGARNCRIHITYEKSDLIYMLEFDTDGMDISLLNNLRQRNELSNKLDELNALLEFKEYKSNAVFILSIPVKSDW